MVDTNLKTLMDMGFSEELSKKALAVNSTLEDAMEWILAHSGDDSSTAANTSNQPASNPPSLHLKASDVETKDKKVEEGGDTASANPTDESKAESKDVESKEDQQANSLKCDECGKLLKDTDAATAHMYKTNHTSFSESVEAIKPKTPEEIEAQKRQLEEKLIKLRAEKEEKEKQEEIEREKNRRKHGRELNDLRQKMHDDELKRIAEERRREKLAAEAQKKKIKEQIAQDRERLKQQQQLENQSKTGSAAAVAPPPVVQPSFTTTPVEKRSYDECKIQVRLTDGKVMMHTFKSKEQLAAVRLWIEMNRTDERLPFSLLQPFPRKQYTDDDMMRTLEDLGLTPASSLVITRKT